MLYDLVVYKDELSTEYIDIKCFPNDSTIQGIIDFTTSFQNHGELMKFLCESGYIPITYINGNFKIHSRRGLKSEPRLLSYGISYKDESKFFSISFLTNYFVKNMNSDEFMDAFIKKYYNYLRNNPLVNSELYHISFCRTYYKQFGYHYNEQHSDAISAETAMRNFIEKYSHRKNAKKEIIPDQLTIRDLAMFAINFERNRNNYNPDAATITINDLESDTNDIKIELSHYRQLLNTLSPDEEQYIFYENKIKELEQELEIKLARRKKDETTGY